MMRLYVKSLPSQFCSTCAVSEKCTVTSFIIISTPDHHITQHKKVSLYYTVYYPIHVISSALFIVKKWHKIMSFFCIISILFNAMMFQDLMSDLYK